MESRRATEIEIKKLEKLSKIELGKLGRIQPVMLIILGTTLLLFISIPSSYLFMLFYIVFIAIAIVLLWLIEKYVFQKNLKNDIENCKVVVFNTEIQPFKSRFGGKNNSIKVIRFKKYYEILDINGSSSKDYKVGDNIEVTAFLNTRTIVEVRKI